MVLRFLVLLSLSLNLVSSADAQTRQAPTSATLSPEAIAKRVMPSVVAIEMTNADGSKSQFGSGFFVSNNLVATNYHLIEGMTNGTVRVVGYARSYSISGVVGYNKGTDLALLQISANVGKPLVLASGERPQIGASVFAVGNPGGLEGTFSPGIVSGLRDFSTRSLVQITAPISPGSSGGPVVNNRGEVIGIASGGFELGQALNFAIPVSALKNLQNNTHSPVSVAAAGANQIRPSAPVADRIQSSPPDEGQSARVADQSPAAPSQPRVIEESDRVLWETVSKENTVSSYEFYLKERQLGAFTEEAKKRIEKLQYERQQRAWENALSKNTREAIQEFVDTFRLSAFDSDLGRRAYEKLGEFDRAEEDAIWRAAEKGNAAIDFRNYLMRYPNGAYAGVARLRLSRLPRARISDGKIGSTITNDLGMKFSWVPPGQFTRGSPVSEKGRHKNEGPQRKITIRSGFWIGAFEITERQYKSVMGPFRLGNFSEIGPNQGADEAESDLPVRNVSWNDAQEFVRRLNSREDEFIYSLPTEAEWEYAARAGSRTAFAFGNSLAPLQAACGFGSPNSHQDPAQEEDKIKVNFADNTELLFLGAPQPIGTYKANAWGIFDMHGNAAEWVEDVYRSSYRGLPTDGGANETSDPTGSPSRILRGGSNYGPVANCRSAFRERIEKGQAEWSAGFRVVAQPR